VSELTENQRISQFIEDIRFLQKRYKSVTMCKKLEEDKGNFSNYINKRKRPPMEFIDLFYEKYGEDLKFYHRTIPQSSSLKEAPNRYGLGAQLELVLQELKEIREKIDALPTGQDVANLSARVENLEKQVLPPNSPAPEA